MPKKENIKCEIPIHHKLYSKEFFWILELILTLVSMLTQILWHHFPWGCPVCMLFLQQSYIWSQALADLYRHIQIWVEQDFGPVYSLLWLCHTVSTRELIWKTAQNRGRHFVSRWNERVLLILSMSQPLSTSQTVSMHQLCLFISDFSSFAGVELLNFHYCSPIVKKKKTNKQTNQLCGVRTSIFSLP